MLTRVLLWVGLLAVTPLSLQAQDGYARHQELFSQLMSNAEAASSQTTGVDVDGARIDLPDGRFNIDPVPNVTPNRPPYRCGVAVWFELLDSRFVNPVKHRWNPEERFYIWIQPAVPVVVSLHQNYPEDRPPSRQVYPDAAHPETFSTIPGGRATRLPVRFKMDDDLRNEIMSMVVVRADHPNLPLNQNRPNAAGGGANNGTTGPGGTIRATVDSLTAWNDEALLQGTIDGESSRFDIEGPGPNAPEISNNYKDVQFFMLGTGLSHQFQVTLFK